MSELMVLDSIAQIHRWMQQGAASHPLVAVIRHCHLPAVDPSMRFRSELYMISLKGSVSGSMGYGRSRYDFEAGTMTFFAPGQVMQAHTMDANFDTEGWSVAFHPDLIRRHPLGKRINQFSFFGYEVNEALHLSEAERRSMSELVDKIERELNQAIDRHTQHLLCSNIELMLDYCHRYYDRQFYTRTNQSDELVQRFESLLRDYFDQKRMLDQGLLSVAYCAESLAISANYLGDLLKKETGLNAREHIHQHVIERAKTALLGTSHSISQVAYDLGFDYPAHFTKLFKNQTGMSPSEFRKH